MKDNMTRKEFLQTLALFGVAAVGGSVVASCGGGGEEAQTQTQSPPPRQAAQTTADPCADVSGLTEAELKMRQETLKYVKTSPFPDKLCDNCKFWQPPAEGATCGGCELIKGPIHPKGYCVSWFQREA